MLLLPLIGYAQNGNDAVSGANLTQWLLLGVVLALILVVIFMVANSFLGLEARITGADRTGKSFAIIPGRDELIPNKLPDGVQKDRVVTLRQGFDVNLLGEPSMEIEDKAVTTVAMQPANFIGMSPLPKLQVAEGDTVAIGDELFYDKKRGRIKYVSPVSGEVIEIRRGEKRAILEVVILLDKEQRKRKHESVPSLDGDRQEVVDFMLEAGVWPMLRQRPYNIVADPDETPKSIFVSTFDTAPQAPNLALVAEGHGVAFQRGLDVLSKLTAGRVHLGLDGNSPPPSIFANAFGVEKHYFRGKHPAGNVGIHIHHVDPVDATQVVWTTGVQDVIAIGELFLHGEFYGNRVIALAGDEFERPRHLRTVMCASIADLIKGELNRPEKEVRVISGDVLSGVSKTHNGYVNFYDDQLTSIEEGNYFELFGWLLPVDPRPSRSGTFPNKLFGKDYKYKATTNNHGEKRAFVVTGEYEAVLPMDILPQHLMKAIMANDFERMEGLGLYELVEEDIAICEFACTSKQPLQRILRQGLDTMRAQG